MSLEEKLYKHFEELSSSIIKALEALEKELSEYIEVTDKRLHKLEEKVQNLESLVAVAGKGLMGAIETSQKDKVSTIQEQSAMTPASPTEAPSEIKIPPVPQPPRRDVSDAKVEPPVVRTDTKVEPPIVKDSEEPPVAISTPAKIDSLQEEGELAKLPPISHPRAIEKISTTGPPSSEAIENEEDKKDLMDALKIIDSL